MTTRIAAIAFACLALAAAGCGDESSQEETTVAGTTGAAGGPQGDGDGAGTQGKGKDRNVREGGSNGRTPPRAEGGTESGSETGSEGEGDDSGSRPQTGGPEGRPPRPKAPGGRPPKRLVVREVVPGAGRTARRGDRVTVHFVGIDYETGREFDSSWERNEPFSFELGAGQIVPGFERGVEGMKVGGRRRLIVPPRLGYGKSGSPPTVAPNATLLFVVDLLEVR